MIKLYPAHGRCLKNQAFVIFKLIISVRFDFWNPEVVSVEDLSSQSSKYVTILFSPSVCMTGICILTHRKCHEKIILLSLMKVTSGIPNTPKMTLIVLSKIYNQNCYLVI